jgi:hypothetical protein
VDEIGVVRGIAVEVDVVELCGGRGVGGVAIDCCGRLCVRGKGFTSVFDWSSMF